MKPSLDCDHEPSEVMELDGVVYYASDCTNALSFDGDLMVNLTKIPNLPSQWPEDLRQYLNIRFVELMVPCPDFGLPKVSPTFWTALHDMVKRKKYKSVCVHCGQGHGRTGTALAALIIANAGLSASEAVGIVREYHCEKAVESSEQCQYLLSLDEFYNKRRPEENDSVVPSAVFMISKLKEKK